MASLSIYQNSPSTPLQARIPPQDHHLGPDLAQDHLPSGPRPGPGSPPGTKPRPGPSPGTKFVQKSPFWEGKKRQKSRPKTANFRPFNNSPIRDKIWPFLPENGHFWPILANFGQFWPILGRFLANFWPILGHFWPILGHFWPILGHFWPILGHFLANLGHFLANLGHFWPI